ncbi:MAG: hypothetical protein RL171_617 [Pseudomonadota bacterium]|jgi:hypothetical protein
MTKAVKFFFLALVVNAASAAELTTFSSATGTTAPAPWQYIALPERYAKPLTAIDVHPLDGKKILRLRADKSWGTVAHPWAGAAKTIEFQWRLDKALPQASFKAKVTEDAAIKVCASFDMPADRMPAGERALFKFVQFFSREKLPTATLCYVWANAEELGSIHHSPTTARVRYMALDNTSSPLKTWKTHKRNLSDDFLKAFGAESPTVPAVTAIIVGADADNTQDTSLGFVADVVVQP